ncbi:MAG: copper resistance protein CopC [Pseudohongiella sp.]|nr:copper resistance protein CopC [Pseudohongiella sp.]MDP2125984.1 copper resistance protein CopC [Pseudohongiella sp.]
MNQATIIQNASSCLTPAIRLAARLTLVLMFTSIFTISGAYAQHFTHTYRYTGDVEIEHIPDHDEVLASAPDNLLLRFTDHVSLVKLVVKTAEGQTINIDFRYNPAPDRVFIWPLPALPASDWYSVDWGVIDRTNKLMSGQFLFSAGPDAKKPSDLVPEVEYEHIMVPDYRLLNLQDYQPVAPQN